VPSSNKVLPELKLDQIEDFGDPFSWHWVNGIREHPEYKRQIDAMRRESYEKGRAEEAQRSRTELESLKGDVLRRLEDLLDRMGEERRRFHEENAEETIRLAMAVAGRILRATLPREPDGLRPRFEACLGRLAGKAAYEIRINPEDEAILRRLMDELGREGHMERSYRILPDARLEPGDLVLESPEGAVEAILEDELRRMEEHLIEGERAGRREAVADAD